MAKDTNDDEPSEDVTLGLVKIAQMFVQDDIYGVSSVIEGGSQDGEFDDLPQWVVYPEKYIHAGGLLRAAFDGATVVEAETEAEANAICAAMNYVSLASGAEKVQIN